MSNAVKHRSFGRGIRWQIYSWPLLLFFSIPLIALFFKLTPQSFIVNIQYKVVTDAIRISLYSTFITVILALVLGTPVAYLLHHRKLPAARVADILVDLPTVLPPAVAGLALLLVFGRVGLIGRWLNLFGIQIPYTLAAVVMAQLFIAAPYYIRATAQGFESVSCEIKRAAALDGASRWQVIRYIMLPMNIRPMLNGLVMCWARALGEFGATILFAGNFQGRTQTMPLAVFLGFESNLDSAVTLAVILIVLAISVLVLTRFVLDKQIHTEPDEWDGQY